jgi:hypothetical protein
MKVLISLRRFKTGFSYESKTPFCKSLPGKNKNSPYWYRQTCFRATGRVDSDYLPGQVITGKWNMGLGGISLVEVRETEKEMTQK